MPYLGNTPTTQNFISGTDYFNGTGSQTAFTLTRTVNSVNDIQVVVNNVVQQPNDAYTLSGTTLTMTSAPSAGTNNVYVRYLSTTTQVITPSQNTVSWNTLDSNTQQDLGLMYKNKIINGNMVIDQRNAGALVTTASDFGYSLDRWMDRATAASKYTVQQNSGSVTPPAGFSNYLGVVSTSAYSVISTDFLAIEQRIEGYNIADLDFGKSTAKTVTLSFWVRSSLTGTFGGSIRNNASDYTYVFSYTISTANTWEQKSITITGATAGTWLTTNGIGLILTFNLGAGSTYTGASGAWSTSAIYNPTGATSVVGTNGATWYITGVQLEVGTQATAFSTAGGSYGAELALCQRYYYRISRTAGSTSFLNLFSYVTNALAYGVIPFPVKMRTSPTSLEQSGTAGDYAVAFAGVSTTCTSVPAFATGTNENNAILSFATTSGHTAGQAGYAYALTANAYLGWSAEL